MNGEELSVLDETSSQESGEGLVANTNTTMPLDKTEAIDEGSLGRDGDADVPWSERHRDSNTTDSQNRQRLLNEVRFGLRQNEIMETLGGSTTKSRRRAASIDYGEEVNDLSGPGASKAIAATLNSLEQRSSVRNARSKRNVEDLDLHHEDDDQLRRGIDLMETELGDSAEGIDEEVIDPEVDMDSDRDDDTDGFYALISKQAKDKKSAKKMRYQVAPKFPRVDLEVEGERAIGRSILKNRGLVAHKNKINRNPRVKKREQYRKALIRRKGAVREVRKDEGHKYGGEETGIKSGISRSRKLG